MINCVRKVRVSTFTSIPFSETKLPNKSSVDTGNNIEGNDVKLGMMLKLGKRDFLLSPYILL